MTFTQKPSTGALPHPDSAEAQDVVARWIVDAHVAAALKSIGKDQARGDPEEQA